MEPKVYILIILGFSIIFYIIASEKDKKEIFGAIGVIYVIISIRLLGFII